MAGVQMPERVESLNVGMVAQWLALSLLSKKVSNLHVIPLPVWVSPEHSGFLPQYKNKVNWLL